MIEVKNKNRYRIKYEDRKGDIHIEVIYAYNYVDVGRRLSYPIKTIIWIKNEPKQNLPKIK